MAYAAPLPGSDDEQKKQQAMGGAPMPSSGGGAPTVGSLFGGGGAPANSGTSSGRYVNLEAFKNANGSMAGSLSNAGGSILDKEAGRFSDAKKPLESANYSPMQLGAGDIRGLVDKASGRGVPAGGTMAQGVNANNLRPVGSAGMANGLGTGAMSLPTGLETYTPQGGMSGGAGTGAVRPLVNLGGQQTAMDTLKGAITQGYSGPMGVDYAMGADSTADLGKLGQTKTIADVLAKDSIAKGTYNSGLRNLDTALLGLDTGVASAQKGLADRQAAFTGQVGTDSAALATKAKGFKDAGDKAKADALAELSKYGGDISSGIDSRVATTNAARDAANNKARENYINTEKAKADAIAKGTYQLNTTPGQRLLSPGVTTFARPAEPVSMAGYRDPYGSMTTAEQATTDDEKQRMATIRSLLGG